MALGTTRPPKTPRMSETRSSPREHDLPICPICADSMIEATASAYISDDTISKLWTCDTCGHGFVTTHKQDLRPTVSARAAVDVDPANRVTEPKINQDEGSKTDWQHVKAEVLRLLRADSLDTPASHLAYIRERIKPVFDHDVMES